MPKYCQNKAQPHAGVIVGTLAYLSGENRTVARISTDQPHVAARLSRVATRFNRAFKVYEFKTECEIGGARALPLPNERYAVDCVPGGQPGSRTWQNYMPGVFKDIDANANGQRLP